MISIRDTKKSFTREVKMIEVRNPDNKLIGKINKGHTVFISECRGGAVKLTINPDNTFKITKYKVKKTA